MGRPNHMGDGAPGPGERERNPGRNHLREAVNGGTIIWSSETGFMEDALAYSGEEGRDKLRKARGRSTYSKIPGWPNGVTRRERFRHPSLNQ